MESYLVPNIQPSRSNVERLTEVPSAVIDQTHGPASAPFSNANLTNFAWIMPVVLLVRK